MSKFLSDSTAESQYKVIIIGAGISGLRTAHDLITNHNFSSDEILILDAQDYVGGRIRQATDFVPGYKVELGAEIMHGANTLLTQFAQENKEEIVPVYCWAHGDGGPFQEPVRGQFGLYYISKEFMTPNNDNKSGTIVRYDSDTVDKEFSRLNEIFWHLADKHEDSIDENLSMQDYLQSLNFNDSMLSMAAAGFSNTLCNNSEDLSLKMTVRWCRLWNFEEEEEEESSDSHEEKEANSGEHCLVNSYAAVINFYKKDKQILLKKVVKGIDYSILNDVRISCEDGSVYRGAKVVVTASPLIIQRERICFSPSLPKEKLQAINQLHVNPACKVFVKFSRRCWPKHVQGMIIADPSFLFPEIWFRGDESGAGVGDDTVATCYATGFTTARYAQRVLSMPQEEVYRMFCTQLEAILSSTTETDVILNEETREDDIRDFHQLPSASTVYQGGRMARWCEDDNTYCGLGYCSPKVGSTPSTIEAVAAPVGNTLFFAGEATNLGAGATAHAALESAVRAASQVAASFK